MKIPFIGNPLIGELLADPTGFNDQGRAYHLLQDYFRGYPIETLRPLLKHDDELVLRAAIWIVSELGQDGRILFDSVVPLLNSSNRYIRYHALEVASVCAIGQYVDHFICIARALQSDDEIIRVLAMRLIANADQTQIESVAHAGLAGQHSDVQHQTGMMKLSRCTSLIPDEVLQMLIAQEPIIRRYGAIAAKRLLEKFPDLIAYAAKSPDPDVSRFAKESLEASAR